MNVEKIFNALQNDEMNSALGIICGELEKQGYTVNLEGIDVNAEGFYQGTFSYLEDVAGENIN